jgi:CHAD domain-containing protein
MFQIATPLTLFQQQIEILRMHVPGVLDGRLDSIHDARIATRRVRELLPLTHEWQRRHVADELSTRFKRMGRSLGRVRDIDAQIELLNYMESQISSAAPTLVLVRQRHERMRLPLMRRLVKRFERLAIEPELARIAAGDVSHRARLWVALTGSWRSQLRRLLADRAHAASDAIAHATGVYFPNRTHQARIAIKKFRYAAEIAAGAGVMAEESLIRDLKKSQDLLGDVHDRQMLIDQLKDAAEPGEGVDQAQMRLAAQAAQAEIDDLYSRFLSRRSQVLDSSQQALRELDRAFVTKSACAVAGVVALAAGIEARRRRQLSRQSIADSERVAAVSVRVPVALPDLQGR